MSSPNSFSPFSSPLALVREDQRARRRAARSRSRCGASPRSGIAKSTSGAPFSVCQSASIAAIFAGWCLSVLRPCRSPTKACTGARIAATTMPGAHRLARARVARRLAAAARPRGPRPRRRPVSPRGEQHVHEAIRERRIEDHRRSSSPAIHWPSSKHVARGRLHPGVEREDPERRERGAERHERRGGDVQPVGHAVHAEEHHAEEGGLEEERGQHLVAEQRPGDGADVLHEARPVGAELERHHDAGHHAHREGEREDLDPELVGGEPAPGRACAGRGCGSRAGTTRARSSASGTGCGTRC